MGKVTACKTDVVTKKSGHNCVGMAVSVCTTPAAPSPIPLPYPTTGTVSEGITDQAMRTKINGADVMTVGSVMSKCHGNEPGTLKEVVSLNTAGPSFPIMGAPTVLVELGMAGITGSPGMMNKGITVGAGASASDAGGGAGGGGGGDGGAGAPGGPGSDSPTGGGGDGGGGSHDAAEGPEETGPEDDVYCPEEGRRVPPGHGRRTAEADMRRGVNLSNASPEGRQAIAAAMFGQPGGGPNQAFWSGSGMRAARAQGYNIQEDAQGAGDLQAANLPGWEQELGEGSGVSPVKAWRTISMRSAENASGTVDAFVAGTAWPGNVFSDYELPVLLHNDNLDTIHFRDPNIDPSPVVATWERGEDGCWRGPPVPNMPATDRSGNPTTWPGFRLNSASGFRRT
ncbi:MAG: DUF4150 domain-containing protein [Polyangiaceae bacterium]|nr:DUF4150 domain-containing protein [Polyangiaceae bacterium]MCW5790019.1 DUF4150 domain-containing protein [Polyangiaceae bacterium]